MAIRSLPALPFRNLTEVVADTLRQAILSGSLKPGQKIMDAEVASQMGISRSPVREALRQLERDGLVTSVPNRGTTVRSLSERDLVQLNAIRGELEGLAAAWACEHIAEADIAALRALLAEIRRRMPPKTEEERLEIQRPIEEFHRLVVAVAQAPLLENVLDGIWMQIRLAMAAANQSPRIHELIAEHESLLEALERRDPMAAKNAARVITERAVDRAIPVLRIPGAADKRG